MLFEIEGRVYFRIDDGAIWEQHDEGEKLILSPIVSRLLHLFIQEKGRVLSREEIMHYVWEKHGLEPSNNSLNQYVSQLRKLMANFQLPDDSIRTVPREGFVLNSSLDIKIENESEPVMVHPLMYRASATHTEIESIHCYVGKYNFTCCTHQHSFCCYQLH